MASSRKYVFSHIILISISQSVFIDHTWLASSCRFRFIFLEMAKLWYLTVMYELIINQRGFDYLSR